MSKRVANKHGKRSNRGARSSSERGAREHRFNAKYPRTPLAMPRGLGGRDWI